MTRSRELSASAPDTREHGPEYARAMMSNWVAQILFTASTSLFLVLPRIMQEQGFAVGWHGLVMASFSAAFVVGLVSGRVNIQRYGYRRPAVAGCFVAAAGCVVQMAGGEWLPAHFVGRALHGLGCAWIYLSLQSRAMALSHVHLRGQTMGMANLPGFITLALSPWIAETMARSGLSYGVFLVAGLLCLALLPVARTVPDLAGADPGEAPPRGYRMNRPEWLALMFCFVHGVAAAFATVLLPSATASGPGWCFTGFFLAYGTVAFVVRAFVENCLRARLSALVLIGTGAMLSLGVCLLAAASTVLTFGMIGCLFGLSHGLFFPSLVQVITRHAGADFLMGRVSKLTAIGSMGAILGQGAAGLCAEGLGLGPALVWGGLVLAGGRPCCSPRCGARAGPILPAKP